MALGGASIRARRAAARVGSGRAGRVRDGGRAYGKLFLCQRGRTLYMQPATVAAAGAAAREMGVSRLIPTSPCLMRAVGTRERGALLGSRGGAAGEPQAPFTG